MTSDRPFAVQTSARMLLAKLWRRRGEFFPLSVKTDEFLKAAPELLVHHVLGVQLEYREMSSVDPTVRIAGFLDRDARLIVIATQFRREWQRFTLAHEIGHWMLHTGRSHFRERQVPGADFHDRQRPQAEIEADLFAAELLMPQKTLRTAFAARFGDPADEGVSNLELAQNLSMGLRRPIDPDELSVMKPSRRAALIAQAPYFRGVHFKPLADQFDVSSTAMGIQLLEAGLVR